MEKRKNKIFYSKHFGLLYSRIWTQKMIFFHAILIKLTLFVFLEKKKITGGSKSKSLSSSFFLNCFVQLLVFLCQMFQIWIESTSLYFLCIFLLLRQTTLNLQSELIKKGRIIAKSKSRWLLIVFLETNLNWFLIWFWFLLFFNSFFCDSFFKIHFWTFQKKGWVEKVKKAHHTLFTWNEFHLTLFLTLINYQSIYILFFYVLFFF